MLRRTIAVACLLLTCFGVRAFGDLEIELGTPAGEQGKKRKIDVPKPGGPARPAAGQRKEDLLKFLNKDALHGTLVSVDPQADLLWRHPFVKTPIHFGLKNVGDILLGSEPSRASDRKTRARVVLTNGDSLLGSVVSLTSDKLVLDTWYAGQLTLERPMVKAIAPNVSVSSYVYEGPDGLTGWTVYNSGTPTKTWTYRNGAFYSMGGYGSIGRDVKLPDMARIEVDMEWRGQVNFNMYFYTDKLDRRSSGSDSYALNVSYDYIYLRRYSRNRGSTQLGNQNVQGLNNRGKAKFTLLVNKKEKKIALLIDNALVKQWVDAADFAGKGTGIVFHPQSNSRVKVSNIVISKWDGNVSASGGDDKAKQQDLIRFVNGDKVSGELKTIKDGKITFTTAYAALNIPLDRAVLILTAEKSQERARRNKNDVQAQFHGGGTVTLDLEKLSDGLLVGSTENFGNAKFKLDAFGKIRFNVYVERPDDDSGDAW